MGRMSHPDSRASPPTRVAGLRTTQLVGRSFRFGMHARRDQSALAWSFAWQEFAGVAGPDKADDLIGRLGDFIQAVDSAAQRRIEVLPRSCPGLCRDECLAVSVVAASQLGACPALKACLFALIENGNVETCIRAAQAFGSALSDAGQSLSQDALCNPLVLMPFHSRGAPFDA